VFTFVLGWGGGGINIQADVSVCFGWLPAALMKAVVGLDVWFIRGLVGPLSLQSQDHPSALNSTATCLLAAGKSK